MLYLTTIVIAFLPAFVFCQYSLESPKFQNPLTSLLLQEDDFAEATVLKPVPSHPLHFQYQNDEGSTPGWLYTYQYNGTDCETDKAALESGMVTNQCFTTESKTQDSNSSSSVMFTCFEDYAYTFYYNSIDCNPETWLKTKNRTLNTCFPVNSAYGLYAAEIFCVEDSILPVSSGEWVVMSSYAEDDCTDLYSFSAFLNNVCYQFEYQTYRYNYPNQTFYHGNSTDMYSVDCSNPYNSKVYGIQPFCVSNDNNTSDDDYEVVQESSFTFLYFSTAYPSSIPTSYPTAMTMLTAYPTENPTTEPTFLSTAVRTMPPTTKTTFVPTAVPSSGAPSVAYLTFTSNITLSGVSSADLDESSQQAIINTTAISMSIPSNQVSFVSDYSVPSSFAASAMRGGKVHSTASSSIVAITKVNAPLSDPSQSAALYTQLTSALNHSVSSNQFSHTLQSVSKATGAIETMNANATGVSSSAATVWSVATSSTSSSNDNGLSGGAIAGIVIGGVAFLAVLLGGGYYLYVKRNSQSSGSSSNAAREAPPTVNIMMSNPMTSLATEIAGVNLMQSSSSPPPPVVAVVIEEGLSQIKQLH